MYQVVFKLPTKFVTVVALNEGEMKILSQEESTSLQGPAQQLKSFPSPSNPNTNKMFSSTNKTLQMPMNTLSMSQMIPQ